MPFCSYFYWTTTTGTLCIQISISMLNIDHYCVLLMKCKLDSSPLYVIFNVTIIQCKGKFSINNLLKSNSIWNSAIQQFKSLISKWNTAIFCTDSSSFTGGFLTKIVHAMFTNWWAVDLPRDSSVHRRWMFFSSLYIWMVLENNMLPSCLVWRRVRAEGHLLRVCKVHWLEPSQQHSVGWRGSVNWPFLLQSLRGLRPWLSVLTQPAHCHC